MSPQRSDDLFSVLCHVGNRYAVGREQLPASLFPGPFEFGCSVISEDQSIQCHISFSGVHHSEQRGPCGVKRSVILAVSVDEQPRVDESCILECHIVEYEAHIRGVGNRDCRDHCLIVDFEIGDIFLDVTRSVIQTRFARQIVEDVSELQRSVLKAPDLLFLAYSYLADSDGTALIAVNVDIYSACRIAEIQCESLYLGFLRDSDIIGIAVLILSEESVGIQNIPYSVLRQTVCRGEQICSCIGTVTCYAEVARYCDLRVGNRMRLTDSIQLRARQHIDVIASVIRTRRCIDRCSVMSDDIRVHEACRCSHVDCSVVHCVDTCTNRSCSFCIGGYIHSYLAHRGLDIHISSLDPYV